MLQFIEVTSHPSHHHLRSSNIPAQDGRWQEQCSSAFSSSYNTKAATVAEITSAKTQPDRCESLYWNHVECVRYVNEQAFGMEQLGLGETGYVRLYVLQSIMTDPILVRLLGFTGIQYIRLRSTGGSIKSLYGCECMWSLFRAYAHRAGSSANSKNRTGKLPKRVISTPPWPGSTRRSSAHINDRDDIEKRRQTHLQGWKGG